MEQFDFRLNRHQPRTFDNAPETLRRRVLGVDYLHLRGKQSGDLYVTRHGWPVLESIVPSQWFVGDRLRKVGRQLAGATGAVYRVPVPHKARSCFALVVKFSRFAQEALVSIEPDEPLDWAERDRMAVSEFLSPFEEIANLEHLRAAAGVQIPTKAPLAIYSPATRYLDWQLGRIDHRRWWYDRVLAEDQAEQPEDARVAYDWERLYVLLYRWIDGIDAETACQQGYLTRSELRALYQEARDAMRERGWDVLDHKARHVIVRPDAEPGRLVRRRGRTLWALVDYELLVPYPAPGAQTLQSQQSQCASDQSRQGDTA
ncbi:hypothetical protein [Halochromatium glycolicum]|uniref:Uncharacterized protein n=1 Tax=Halochromatium glycolicum TaxID=85075 RepID=A0AAJ0U5W8_9GAMM|nr:hypothetical protein [Halochromatium glycolicum]MBK1705864.1 hypothetical protein [Halochromatium glycolicum]